MKWEEFPKLVARHRFLFAIGAVIAVSMLMTAVSLSLYVSSGTSRLDLSRPGYESVRQDVQEAPEDTFRSDGVVDKAALDEFEKLLHARRSNLNGLGDFEDQLLDDSSLRLEP